MATTTYSVHSLDVGGIGSVDVSVGQRGEGQTFVILHGGAGPQSIDNFADLLADNGRARVITPTHPGFDGTHRPDTLDSVGRLAPVYVALLEELGLSDVTLVGNSIGGWIAAEMAVLGSARLARVVLVGATGIEVSGHPVADISTLTLDQVVQLSYYDPEDFRVDPSTWPASVRATAAANRATLLLYGGPLSCDPGLRERLSSTDVPTLVVWGDSDGIVDPDYGRAYAQAIPNAQFHLLPACGHLPQLEAPEQLLTAISDFTEAHHAWVHTYAVETDVAAQDIWSTLKDLYTGTKLSENGDTITIHGPFAVGTALTAIPPDSDTVITCTITALVDGQTFAIESEFNGLIITTRHLLTPLGTAGTRITQYSTISGPRARQLGPQIGPRITADHPEAMNDLIIAATSRNQHEQLVM